MTISLRLDARTAALLKRLAEERRESKSEIIRQAICAFSPADAAVRASPYAQMKDLIGVADSGGLQLAKGSGAKFKELLERRSRERRPR